MLLLTAATWLQASAKGYGQTITLSLKNAPLEKVFRAIEEQSSFHFIYTKEELAVAKRVSIVMNNALLADVLEYCFKDQPLSYSIKGPYIIVKAKRAISLTVSNVIDNSISGRVINEEGDAIVGATVSIKGTNIATATNENGEWRIENADGNKSIVASSIGYESGEVAIGKGSQSIVLKRIINNLYETVVIAYGKTIRRMNTGNVSKVTAAEIARQPISNPIAALQGRVPGMVITQTSGVTGSSFNIEIRGRTSLDLSLSKNDPLFIIDGVPFEPGNLPSNQLMSAVNNPRQVSEGGISPFNTINPADIESVEILKDADATAIYGSRGANGVILITTKKGTVGKARV
ncbi:MAG TPA: TonB-dependent receptor plug domain-containing protein, partial [Chitinophagaceae bacterium]